MPKNEAKKPDFAKLRESGRVFKVNQSVKIIWFLNGLNSCRVGFSISAKDFNSVSRNQLKRLVRALVKGVEAEISDNRGIDFHVQIRKFPKGSFDQPFDEAKKSFRFEIIQSLSKIKSMAARVSYPRN